MYNGSRQNLEFLDVQYRALIRVGLDIGATSGKDFLKSLGKVIYFGVITTYLQYGLILFAVHIFSVQIDNASATLSVFNQGSLIMLKAGILMFKSDRLLKLIWDMNLLASMVLRVTLTPFGHNTVNNEPNNSNIKYLSPIQTALVRTVSSAKMYNGSRQNLEFLDVQYRALIRVGLDIGATRGKDFLKSLGKVIYYGVITTYLQYGLILFAVHIFSVQIDKASAALSMFNQGSLLMLKAAILMFKSDRLLKLIWDMNLLASMANEAEEATWLSENRLSKVIGNVYSTACIGSVILSALIPILFMSYEYFKGLEVNLKLPFDGKFPYEDRGISVFILNYILSLIYVYTLLCLTIGIDTLFGWLIHAVSGHFRILRLKVERAAAKIDVDGNHGDFIRDVGSIVRYHNKTLQFVDALNDIFGQIFWAEVAFSCLQMCFLIFTLNNGTDKRMIPFNGMVFTAISIQVMIYCFGGEKIKTENNMLCDDIYNKFPWEKMYPSEKKLMLLPLMRSQQDASLVGLFFELDRNLLVYIYRTAFSFNTLLGAMDD